MEKVPTLLPIYVSMIAVVVIVGSLFTYVLAISGNFNQPVPNFLDAVYFTVVTISTVGYGDIVPVTMLGKAFTIILLFIGLGVFASTATFLSGEIMNRRIRTLNGKITLSERRSLNKHIVLIGHNSTNMMLAKILKDSSKKFIIVSPDKVVVDQLNEDKYHAYVVDVTSSKDMQQLKIPKASHVVIDMRDDSLTVYVALLIRNLSKDIDMTVVADSAEVEKHLESIGITNTVNPADIAAKSIISKHHIADN